MQRHRQTAFRKSRLASVEHLEARRMLSGGGITIITHGFQTSVGIPDWEVTMAQAILDRADGPLTDRNVGSLLLHDPNSGLWEPVAPSIWNNNNSADDHTVLVYDWSLESDFFEDGWLEAAADHLFATLLQKNDNLGGDFAGHSFVDIACNAALPMCTDLDFHFIGHSRGAVLNSLTTSRFGEQFPAITIEQVTSLDPHPASSMNDLGYVASNPNANSRLFTYSNVGFADNYFRQDGLYELDGDFNGVLANGAFNVQIPESVLSNGGSFFEHLDVHTWYYGTVTEPFSSSYSGFSGAGRNHDGDTSFPETWYNVPGVPARDNAGFAFSALGGNDRGMLPTEYVFQGSVSQPNSSASVFNGDFRLGSNGSNDIPGWTYHASGGSATIAGTPRYLQLGSTNNFRQHNPLYFNDNVGGIQFDYWVNASGLADALQIVVNDTIVDTVSLDTATTGFVSEHVASLGTLEGGFVGSLAFRVVDTAGGNVAAQVRVDNISLVESAPVIGDFDDDGDLDCDDINALSQAIASSSTDLTFDLNSDQMVTQQDLDIWLAIAGAANLASGNPFLNGDVNLDGVVDGSDFIVWNQHKFTANSAWCSGDFTADGFVDGFDFIVWNQHKFMSADLAARVNEVRGQSGAGPIRRAIPGQLSSGEPISLRIDAASKTWTNFSHRQPAVGRTTAGNREETRENDPQAESGTVVASHLGYPTSFSRWIDARNDFG